MKKVIYLILVFFAFPILSKAQLTVYTDTTMLGHFDVLTCLVNGDMNLGMKISTKIPAKEWAKLSIFIKGYDATSVSTDHNLNLQISWGEGPSGPSAPYVSSAGSVIPPVYFTAVNDTIQIYLAQRFAYTNFEITASAYDFTPVKSWFQNWQITNEALPTSGTLAGIYDNRFGVISASQINAGSIYSGSPALNGQGLFYSSLDNNFVQNAYFDGYFWRSITSGTYGRNAIKWSTGGLADKAFNLLIDTTIAVTNDVLDFSNIFTITRDGSVGINKEYPSQKLDVTGNAAISGRVLIGSVNPAKATDYLLAVNGNALFTKAVVKLYSNWPDYVFEKEHKLMPLTELEKYVQKNKHLPEVPSAKEIEENGIDVGANQAILLKKVEELTLYMIEQGKKIEAQQKEIDALKEQLQNKKN